MRRGHFTQLTVDAHAHPVLVFVRLKVQVRGLERNGLFQKLLYVADHRRIIVTGKGRSCLNSIHQTPSFIEY